MKILITSAASRLQQELAASLGRDHDIRLTDRKDITTSYEFVRSDLGHDESTNALVKGMDAIIHSGEVYPNTSVSEQLDSAMRGTYNLLWAAREEGVSRVVYLSSLKVMGKYDEDLAVTERWKPSLTTDSDILCYHLGEFVCREFAREQNTNAVSLRLGDLVWDTDSANQSTSALHVKDAVQAVENALTVEVTQNWTSIPNAWNIFHIQSSVPDQRFITNTAQEILGFQPSQRGQS